MFKFLNGMPYPVDMQILTAPVTDLAVFPILTESKDWPTRINVLSAIQRTKDRAQAGDFVYIHFSGIGDRINKSQPDRVGHAGDVELCLLHEQDPQQLGSLTGLDLAYQMQKLVEKRLSVTVVLDCCFSGGISRTGDGGSAEVRCLDPKAGATVVRESSYNLNDWLKPAEGYLGYPQEVSRKVSMLPSWIVNPKGYAILAACGPDEKAIAIPCQEDRQAHGALSYFLRKTLMNLRDSGATRTLADIYGQLSMKFRHASLSQNPILYGNGKLQFLGPSLQSSSWIPALRLDETPIRLWLQAGEAHGICKDDMFVIEPFDPSDGNMATRRLRATVVNIGPLTSTVEVVAGAAVPGSYVPSRWIAQPSTRLALRAHPVRASTGLPELERWKGVAQQRHWLDVRFMDDPKAEFVFHIAFDDVAAQFRIWSRTGELIPGLPIPPPASEDVAGQILDLIERLLLFKHLEEATGPTDASFRRWVNVQVETLPEALVHKPGGDVVVHCKPSATKKVLLRVRNHGVAKVYVNIIAMGSRWEVDINPECSEETVLPRSGEEKGQQEWELDMTMGDGERQHEDILKVFVTSRPANFFWCQLPEIDIPFQRERPKEFLAPQRDEEQPEAWAVFNFRVRMIIDKD
jgi:hypothetical protein